MISVKPQFDNNVINRYNSTLALYLQMTKKDVQFALNKKAVDIRLNLLRGLGKVAPGQAKIKSEFTSRGYRMRLHGKAKQAAETIYKTKEEYKSAFSKRGMKWTENIAKLSTPYLSRMIGNEIELKRRRASNKFLSAMLVVANHKAEVGGNGQLTRQGRDGKTYTVITLASDNIDSSTGKANSARVNIFSRAPEIGTIIQKHNILSSALMKSENDMLIYIQRKLEENKKVIS